jgi:hypothetical protein
MDNIFNILSFLPIEIINMIIPYTYEAQSKALTDDIKNFYTMKAVASQLYYNRFVMEFEEPEPSDKDWFINDLFFFSNQFIPTMHGYGDNFVNLFLRNISLKTNTEVFTYIQRTKERPVNTQINIFLGIFTLEERKAFLNRFYPGNIITF